MNTTLRRNWLVVGLLGVVVGCGDNIRPGEGTDNTEPPVAVDDVAAALEDTAVTFDVTGNDTDDDGGPLAVASVTQPTNGEVTLNGDGTLTYLAGANFNGDDTFTYTLNGGSVGSVTMQVVAVNDAPSFVVGPVASVTGGAAETMNPWATAVSAGPADEVGQTVAFEITGNTNTAFFTTLPAVSPTGVLTFATVSGPGFATITLRMTDSGGVANGGVDTSATQSFGIRNGAPTITLRSLDTYVAVSGAGLTNSNASGTTMLNGDVGLSPTGTCIGDGVPCTATNPVITGTLHVNDAAAAQAKTDLEIAYTEAAARPPGTAVNDISGMVLLPGVYTSASTMSIAVGGAVTLDGQGDDNAVWVFQIGSSLTVNNNAQVLLINGARAKNVFWAAFASSTLGSEVSFQGTVLAGASNTVGTDSTVVGRLLCSTGMITLLSNTITLPPL